MVVAGIVGANGCGKTTTLKAMMGLLPSAGGEVLVEGKPLSRMLELLGIVGLHGGLRARACVPVLAR